MRVAMGPPRCRPAGLADGLPSDPGSPASSRRFAPTAWFPRSSRERTRDDSAYCGRYVYQVRRSDAARNWPTLALSGLERVWACARSSPAPLAVGGAPARDVEWNARHHLERESPLSLQRRCNSSARRLGGPPPVIAMTATPFPEGSDFWGRIASLLTNRHGGWILRSPARQGSSHPGAGATRRPP
jgi:hypothetical protein